MEDEATIDADEVLEEGGGACGEHAKRDVGDGAERGAKQRNGRLGSMSAAVFIGGAILAFRCLTQGESSCGGSEGLKISDRWH